MTLTTQMLSIHRLVQAVVKENMDEQAQRLWAERTVEAVNRAFPAVEKARTEEANHINKK